MQLGCCIFEVSSQDLGKIICPPYRYKTMPVKDNNIQPNEDLFEKCNACSQLINVRLLREHMQNCVFDSELQDSFHLNGGTMSSI